MKRSQLLFWVFTLAFSSFLVTSIIYSYLFFGGNQPKTLLYLESPKSFVIADDNQSNFWFPWKGSILSDDPNTKISGINSLVLSVYTRRLGGLFEHSYETIQDWHDKDFFAFFFYGQNTGYIFRIHIKTPDWDNRAYFDFYDNFNGWRKVFIPLHKPTGISGNYNLSCVKTIIWALPNKQATGTWNIDRVTIEKETIWSNLENIVQFSIYFSAISLAASAIAIMRKREKSAPNPSKICMKDYLICILLGLASGCLVLFTILNTGWLAYLASFLITTLTIALSIISQRK